MVPLSLFASIILFGWAGVHSYSGILLFDIFYGFVMSAAQGMLPPSMGSLTTDLSKMGTRMGMIFSICGFALLIGQPLAGVLITADGGKYLYAQMYAGGALLIGAVFLGAARVKQAGWDWTVKV
jgi:MFS family permease